MDITKMVGDDVPYADVWTFGFPCQDLSYAGKQAGMKVKCNDCGHEYDKEIENDKCPECGSTKFKASTRSGLFFEVMRLLNEVNEKPKVILAENVKALKKYLPILEKEYKKVGYKTFYTIYNSKYWGVPQNRERYFVVGIREDLNVDFKFPKQQTQYIPKLASVLETEVDEKYYLSEEKSRKIIERFNINKHNEPVSAPLRFLDRNQKEVPNYSLCLDASQTNGVAEPNKEILGKCIDDQGRIKKELKPLDISPTLRAEEHGNTKKFVVDDNTPKIIASRGRYNEEGRTEQNFEVRKDNVSNTLTSVQKDNLVLVNRNVEEIAKETGMLHSNGVGKTLRVGGRGSISKKHNYDHIIISTSDEKKDDTQKTILVRKQANEFVRESDVSNTLLARDYKGFGNQEMNAVIDNFRVRKLTPREYARLQGFPDEYKIVVSDTQFYKQMGNAVTVNVAKVIAKAIKEQVFLNDHN